MLYSKTPEGEWGQKGEGGCQTTKDRRCTPSISAKKSSKRLMVISITER